LTDYNQLFFRYNEEISTEDERIISLNDLVDMNLLYHKEIKENIIQGFITDIDLEQQINSINLEIKSVNGESQTTISIPIFPIYYNGEISFSDVNENFPKEKKFNTFLSYFNPPLDIEIDQSNDYIAQLKQKLVDDKSIYSFLISYQMEDEYSLSITSTNIYHTKNYKEMNIINTEI